MLIKQLYCAGRHPPRHLPAANVLRPYHIHALSHTSCLRLISIYEIKAFQPEPSSQSLRRLPHHVTPTPVMVLNSVTINAPPPLYFQRS